MAHRISSQSGKAEFSYVSQAPWHGLGEQRDWATPQEAVAKTVPFEVALVKQSYVVNGVRYDNPVDRAIVRTDTGTRLGTATDQYLPIQNAQAADIADALIAEGAKCVDTIGALDDGARCFMLLSLDKSGFEIKGSRVLPYFLLRWGHDARTPVSGKLTNVYVVCHNTLTAAGSQYSFNIKHHANAKLRIEQAREALGVTRKAYVETRAQYQALAAKSITPAQVVQYFGSIFPSPVQDAGLGWNGSKVTLQAPEALTQEQVDRLAKWEGVQRRLLALYSGEGKGSLQNGPTAWGVYNAVTEYLDHVYPVMASGKVSTTRQQSVLFGSYSDVRDGAYRDALALLK